MYVKAPNYLINFIPKYESTIRTRNNSIPSYKCWTNCFKHSFFLLPKLVVQFDINIRNKESVSLWKSRLLSFIHQLQNSMYNIFDPERLKFLTWLRLGLSHLNVHRFHYNFHNCLNPLCSCSLKTDDKSY